MWNFSNSNWRNGDDEVWGPNININDCPEYIKMDRISEVAAHEIYIYVSGRSD